MIAAPPCFALARPCSLFRALRRRPARGAASARRPSEPLSRPLAGALRRCRRRPCRACGLTRRRPAAGGVDAARRTARSSRRSYRDLPAQSREPTSSTCVSDPDVHVRRRHVRRRAGGWIGSPPRPSRGRQRPSARGRDRGGEPARATRQRLDADASCDDLPQHAGGIARARSRARSRPGHVHVRARRQQVRRQPDSAHRSGVRPRNRRSAASAAAAGNHRPPSLRTSPVATSRSGRPRSPAKRVLYIGYNETLVSTSAVARRTSKAVKAKRLRAVIVDLRNNGGGDNHTYRLSARRIAARVEDRTDRRAHLADDVFRSRELRRRSRASGAPHLRRGAERWQPEPLRRHRQHAAARLGRRAARRADLLADVDCRRSRGSRSIRRCRSLSRRDAFFAGRDPVLDAAVGAALGAPKLLAVTPPRFSYDRGRPLGLRLGEAQTSDGVVRQPLTFDAGRGQKKAYWTHPGGIRAVAGRSLLPGIGRQRDEPASGCRPPGATRHRLPDARPAAGARQLPGDRRRARLYELRDRPPPGARPAAIPSRRRCVARRCGGLQLRLCGDGGSRRRGPSSARGAVLQSGRAHLSTPIAAFCRGRLGAKKLKAYLRAYSAIDPVRYVARAAPASLLFQNGTRDPVSPRKDVDAYFRAASKPKEQRFYDAAARTGRPGAQRPGRLARQGPARLESRLQWRRFFLPSATSGA